MADKQTTEAPEPVYGNSYPGQYNWLYHELKKMYPDWSEDQLVRSSYADYFKQQDEEKRLRDAQDDAAKAGLINTGASIVGSALTAALLGML